MPIQRIAPEAALARLSITLRDAVLSRPGVEGRINAYRSGEISFDDLVQTPDWRNFVRKAMRSRATASWVDEDDLMQELRIILLEANGDPATNPRAFDPSRSSSFSKFVVHQVIYWLRDVQRRQANVPHRKGAAARGELLILDVEEMTGGGSDSNRKKTNFDRIVGGVPAEQEATVARKCAIEGLDERVRSAVAELFDSGSFDRAILKVRGSDDTKSRRRKLRKAVASVLEESNV